MSSEHDIPARRQRFQPLTWLGSHDLATLVLALFAAAAAWAFAVLAGEVFAGETGGFDHWLILALRDPADPTDPLGPGWLEELGRDVTALGGVAVLCFVTLAAAGLLLLQDKGHAALWLVAAVAGGLVLSQLMKYGFDRPRPDLVPHAARVYTKSFPSGHSMMSAVTYLTLGALLSRAQARRRIKAYLLILALFTALAVGVSRVYLGVHWPTDVLAGWTAGAAWALLCWLIARRLERRGRIESGGIESGSSEGRDA